MKFKSNKNGFTLLEVLIALAVTMLVFLLIFSIYHLSQGAYQRTDVKAELTQNGRVILDRLVRELRQTPDVVTVLPLDDTDPDALPNGILFEDGHNVSEIKYLKYLLNGTEMQKQVVVYHFADAPDDYVHHDDTDQYGNPPTDEVLETKVIGEYVSDIEFWGSGAINIKLYLTKNGQTEIMNTIVYGRNL
ncbi:MAG: prepilin-type N-terminal cleavage/methylation domain-containing protein [Patescibacteria group bacterium]